MPGHIQSNAVKVLAKLVAAHALRDQLNERIHRLTAELKEAIFSTAAMKEKKKRKRNQGA
jgi:hypothetical protein